MGLEEYFGFKSAEERAAEKRVREATAAVVPDWGVYREPRGQTTALLADLRQRQAEYAAAPMVAPAMLQQAQQQTWAQPQRGGALGAAQRIRAATSAGAKMLQQGAGQIASEYSQRLADIQQSQLAAGGVAAAQGLTDREVEVAKRRAALHEAQREWAQEQADRQYRAAFGGALLSTAAVAAPFVLSDRSKKKDVKKAERAADWLRERGRE